MGSNRKKSSEKMRILIEYQTLVSILGTAIILSPTVHNIFRVTSFVQQDFTAESLLQNNFLIGNKSGWAKISAPPPPLYLSPDYHTRI